MTGCLKEILVLKISKTKIQLQNKIRNIITRTNYDALKYK